MNAGEPPLSESQLEGLRQRAAVLATGREVVRDDMSQSFEPTWAADLELLVGGETFFPRIGEDLEGAEQSIGHRHRRLIPPAYCESIDHATRDVVQCRRRGQFSAGRERVHEPYQVGGVMHIEAARSVHAQDHLRRDRWRQQGEEKRSACGHQ